MPEYDIVQIYNQNMERLAFLQNAFSIGYKKILNNLWLAKFTLPADDPKNRYCQPFNYVEIYDGKERVELFRIVGIDLTRSNQAQTAYNCEHVLATLIDDVLFKYHQIGNLGVPTPIVIRYVLDAQTVKNWRLGQCDFIRQFEYKWENENLLSAVFSIPKPFEEDYVWSFDTTAYPWTLNLNRRDPEIKSEIRYAKNMDTVQKTVDATNTITKLYCLGYGEGDNQLTISSVNNGLPYLIAPTINKWGVKSSILVDRRYEDPVSFKAYAEQILKEAQDPYISYAVNAIDLYKVSKRRFDKFNVGDTVRVVDKEDDITANFPIIEVEKTDITGSPSSIKVTIANKSQDISGTISELANRARINETYAQGATNQMIVSFADNADKDHPATLDLYIPDTMVRINKCVLNFRIEPFRAYEKGAASGGGETTSQSSATSSGASSEETTGASSITSSGASSSQTTGASSRTSSGSSSISTTESAYELQAVTYNAPWEDGRYEMNMIIHISGEHQHGLFDGMFLVNGVDFANQQVTYAAFKSAAAHRHSMYAHQHSVLVPPHTHGMEHLHFIDHSHEMPHTHNIDHIHSMPHNHDISHIHTVPEHTHDMVYGIFEGDRADSVAISVDGKPIMATDPNGDIDIINYLSVDSVGKIQRNKWHKIEITPNKLTRIVANVFMQIFTNSRGGGDY